VNVDVRVVCASNADLPRLAEQGSFKADLLDRLSFEVLRLPPLREREGDVMLLARHFAARMAAELGLEATPEIGPAAEEELLSYHWPGNVRELKNVVERAVYRARGEAVSRVDLNPFGAPASPSPTAKESAPEAPGGLPRAVDALKVRLLRQALSRAQGNQAEAARLLGLSYDQFRGLYRKYRHALASD
jgi:psp operon transcriptional activator